MTSYLGSVESQSDTLRRAGCDLAYDGEKNISLFWRSESSDRIAAEGATVSFSGGTLELNGATSSGAGSVLISGGTVNAVGTSNFASTIAQRGGTLGGAGTLNVTGLFTWTYHRQRLRWSTPPISVVVLRRKGSLSPWLAIKGKRVSVNG